MKNIAIIQARMGSSRLPGKVLLPLGGKPAIQHVVERTAMIQGISRVIIATSLSPEDDVLAKSCKSFSIPIFRGKEDDVLDRFYKAAVKFDAEVIMRITGDCPLIDPVESEKVLNHFYATNADYASNTNPPMLPDGLDTEVINFKTLEKAWRDAKMKSEREHVTLYIYKHPDKFKLASVIYSENLSHHRWTLDENHDYKMLSRLFEEIRRRNKFGYLNEVLEIVQENPEITEQNQFILRNEGLAKSIRKDIPDDNF